jgi:predicted NBD/HSP70 family sugar kinase
MSDVGAPRFGIDLGGTKIEILALDAGGEELLRRRVAAPRDDYAATLAAIVALVAEVERELGVAAGIASVGVGTPGSRSPRTGLLRGSNSVWLNGRPIREDLEARLGRPVAVANDANCFALSEATDGAGQGAAAVFGVILGTGVGGGLVLNGRVLEGHNAIAGEWGHNPLPWADDDERPGPACYCGQAGCIETFLSGPALAADHARHGGGTADAATIVARADAGDTRCLRTLERYESRLARALAHLINIVDPDIVVLGGGLSNIARLYENVPRLWGAWVFADAVDTRLVRNVHGDSSGVRGAAWLCR